ncbi:putative coat protein [Colletotrichum fructicola chrysovirus 1]|uniref:Putative coat protein n=1 Tax=Colletotrichum fructicola chrysovirus 1 TaxID=2304034 RepID=A0A346IME0_9VIRU|nr:putative coat protein [Colletotrichum fructicola chrysovirus 1]AXP19675.1 putative coat protein [Colletotrichum fructicola chrysovirus 1]
MADELFASMVDAQPSLGMHDTFRADDVGNAYSASPDFDLSGDGAASQAVAAELLGPLGWELYQSLGPDNTTHVTVQYYLEQEGVRYTSPNLRSVDVTYSEPTGREVYFAYRAKRMAPFTVSQEAATHSLRKYAVESMTGVPLGAGVEQHHYRVLQTGLHIESLLTTMWLIHLDVVAGADAKVNIDQGVRQALAPGLNLEQERDYAKTLPGVRVHINSLDNVAKALIVAACDRNTLVGASARTARYQWARVPLTMYGGQLPGAMQVALNSPDATARAIVNFADHYGSRVACGMALRTACMLYGITLNNSKVVLNFAEPSLHEGTHANGDVMYGLNRCRELAGRELVALAVYLGHTLQQTSGQAIRGAVLGLGAKDVPNVENTIARSQSLLLQNCGRRLHEWWQGACGTYLDVAEYVRLNLKHTTAQRGVIHALSVGFVAEGTMLETVSQPITLRSAADVAVGDDPYGSAERTKASAQWYVVSGLLTDGGESLQHSVGALSRTLGPHVKLHPHIRHFAGSTVRFVIAGFTAPMHLSMATVRDVVHQPVRTDDVMDVPIPEGAPEIIKEVVDQLEPETDSNWLEDMLDQRGPVATTTMRARRTQQTTAQKGYTRGTPITVSPAPSGDGADELRELTDRGWGPEHTSGEGLLCGARAVKQSLDNVAQLDGARGPLLEHVLESMRHCMTPDQQAMASLAEVRLDNENFTVDQLALALHHDRFMMQCGGDRGPLLEHVLESMRHCMTPDQQAMASLAEVRLDNENFTVDQLALGLRQLGDYRLGVVHRSEGGARASVHGPGDGQVVYVYNDGAGHWQSVGPGCEISLRGGQ